MHHLGSPQHGWQLTKLGSKGSLQPAQQVGEGSFSGASASLNLIQVAQLVSAPSGKLIWSQNLCNFVWLDLLGSATIWGGGLSFLQSERNSQLSLFTVTRRNFVNLVGFRDFQKLS